MHSVALHTYFSEPTTKIWMKTDPYPYYQRQKCRPGILVSAKISFMQIFAGGSLERGRHFYKTKRVTCHMGSHSVTCYPTQVNASRLNPGPQTDTRFTYPGGMEG